MPFDESQWKIVYAWRNHLPDDHASPAFEERVIVLDVRRHLATMVDASKAYVEAMSSTINFLLEENDRMEKDLQEVSQRIEQFVGYAKEEIRKEIHAKVLTLETTIWKSYDIFVTMHKVVVHLYGFQYEDFRNS